MNKILLIGNEEKLRSLLARVISLEGLIKVLLKN